MNSKSSNSRTMQLYQNSVPKLHSNLEELQFFYMVITQSTILLIGCGSQSQYAIQISTVNPRCRRRTTNIYEH